MIERVHAGDDPRLADYAHVGDAAWLCAHGIFVAEGRLVVRRLIERGRHRVRSVLVTPAAERALGPTLAQVAAPVFVCDQAVLDAVTGFNFHRGCLALAARPAESPSLECFTGASRLIGLEGVNNPDNVGGIFRAAAALGADGVLLDPTSGDPLYRKAIRTSMGASLHVPYACMQDWPAALEALRVEGVVIVALTPDPSAVPIADYARTLPPDRRLLLLLGAEGPGLSDQAFAASDVRVRIPVDPDVDSLNVVVAAGVALAFLRPSSGGFRL